MGGLLVHLLLLACSLTASAEPWRFASDFTLADLKDPEKAQEFKRRYLLAEAPFFAAARHPESGLTYDGWDLDPESGEPRQPRTFSAASKECLDLALCVKGLYGDPDISLVISPDEPARAPELAAGILAKKIRAYETYERNYPGFGGYFTWFASGPEAVPLEGWSRAFPTLDMGEMLWALLAVEQALKENGYPHLAEDYADYNRRLADKAREALWEPHKQGVRGRVEVSEPRGEASRFSGEAITTGEHGVHEGQMIVLYACLFADLTPQEQDEVWNGITFERVEHKYGTSWRGFWGSAHEEWAYLFLPYRDLPEYADLFRIRQKIRTQNAAERDYRGLAASAHHPQGKGYMSALGIEGLASQPLEYQDFYTPYGAFPVLLHFSDKESPNVGLAWLWSSLTASGMQGPFGAGESGDHSGRFWAPVKTIDASFTTLLALSGGISDVTARLLKERGLYGEFRARMRAEYREAFADTPLREPTGFAWPPEP